MVKQLILLLRKKIKDTFECRAERLFWLWECRFCGSLVGPVCAGASLDFLPDFLHESVQFHSAVVLSAGDKGPNQGRSYFGQNLRVRIKNPCFFLNFLNFVELDFLQNCWVESHLKILSASQPPAPFFYLPVPSISFGLISASLFKTEQCFVLLGNLYCLFTRSCSLLPPIFPALSPRCRYVLWCWKSCICSLRQCCPSTVWLLKAFKRNNPARIW